MDDLLTELVAAKDGRLRAICAANDRNGDLKPCDAILRWAADEPDFAGTLGFLLELAP